MAKSKLSLSTTHLLLLSFAITILVGSVLLSLPISSASGEQTPYIDALFTATTSTCVTGLTTVTTVAHWSLFGQIVILFLIQIGGLGVITALTGITAFVYKKLGLSDRFLLQDTMNISTMSGIVPFLKRVIIGTFTIEGIGALLYMTVFVKDFGLKGIWISIFTSISAFCNAGIDIIADNSLVNYVTNPIVNFTTCFLIVLGGLGYIVWWDVLGLFKNKNYKSLSLHSKIVLSSTFILIFVGAVLFFIFEYNNPLTMQNLSLFDKVQASFFQSVTTRTAGFFTLPQEKLTNASSVVSLLLMFIGGSPAGTAGGVKTVTMVVVFVSALATIQNKQDTNLFDRKISKDIIRKSIAVVSVSFAIAFLSTLLLSIASNANFLDVIYETVSATATVGLSRSLTPTLNVFGKIIVICTMYLGRVGPISMAIAFNVKRENKNIIKNPKEDICVG